MRKKSREAIPKETEAGVLRVISDYLDLLQAQGKLLYIRHNPSTVISKVVHGKIKTAFKKVRQSQLGSPDLIVFRRVSFSKWGAYTDILLIEVKSATGKISTAQDSWAKLAVTQGCRYIVARSLEDIRKEIG